jgi:hypothetical protein
MPFGAVKAEAGSAAAANSKRYKHHEQCSSSASEPSVARRQLGAAALFTSKNARLAEAHATRGGSS